MSRVSRFFLTHSVVTCPTCAEKFIRDNVVAPSLRL